MSKFLQPAESVNATAKISMTPPERVLEILNLSIQTNYSSQRTI